MSLRYFYDCEFNEDGPTIDLISIGVAASDGREFYACSTAARLDLVGAWHREHVLPSLPPYADPAWMERAVIATRLREFIRPAEGEKRAELWAYYGAYDHVCLSRLFGTMLQLPSHFPMFTRDLKQLAVARDVHTFPPKPPGAHNALVDARWNRELYAFLMAKPSGFGTRITGTAEPTHRRIPIGTCVRTVKPFLESKDWTAEALRTRKWNVTGKIVDEHDAHGLCYDVEHEDGTRGRYEPRELATLDTPTG